MLKKAFVPKKKKKKKNILETFHYLVSLTPFDIFVQCKMQGDKRTEILSWEFHFAIHQFVERKVTIEAFISDARCLTMTSNFDNILIIVAK